MKWPYSLTKERAMELPFTALTSATNATVLDDNDILVLHTNFGHQEMCKVRSVCDKHKGNHARHSESMRRDVAEWCPELRCFTIPEMHDNEDETGSQTSLESEELMDVDSEGEGDVGGEPSHRASTSSTPRHMKRTRAPSDQVRPITSYDGPRTEKRFRTADRVSPDEPITPGGTRDCIDDLESHVSELA